MSSKLGFGRRRLLVVSSLLAVAAVGAAAWQWRSRLNPIFEDRPVGKQHVIPANLRNIPVDIPPAQPEAAQRSTVRFALGDRLRITLYERVDLSDEEQVTIPATGLVERTELTGDYVVQENGYIVLPLLGTIEVDGQSIEQVVKALQTAFKQTMRRGARASVVLLDREPVYVFGKGIKPGAFKYSPAMTVLHAVALAGGGRDENSNLYARTEYAHGLEKLEIATQRLKKLLAKDVALHAQQKGQPPEVSVRLIELVGPQDAKKLVDAAVAVQKLIVEARQPQVAAYQAALAAARQEAASQTTRIAVLDDHTKLQVQRRDTLADIRKHNDGLAFALVQMQNEVANVKEKKQEAVAALSQAQTRMSQAEQSLAKLQTDVKLELQNEIISTENQIAEQEATVKANRRLTTDLRIVSLRFESADQNLSYEIVRRGRQGVHRLEARETTELFPGDLVQVRNSTENSGL